MADVTVTSADPARLSAYLDEASGPTGQLGSEAEAAFGATQAFLASGSAQGGSLGGISALGALLEEMAGNDNFVAAVIEALVAADRGGVVGELSVADPAIAGRLASDGVGAEVGYLSVGPDTLFGQPPSSGFADDPVCALTGNFVHEELDVAFPGRSGVLNVSRCYNSLAAGRVGAFGSGWSSVLDVSMSFESDRVSVSLPDGAVIGFVAVGGAWVGEARPGLGLSGSAEVGFMVSDGAISYGFDHSGLLSGWSSGRARVVVERDGDGTVVCLAEEASGRRVGLAWSGGLVASVSSSDGRSCSYTYSGRELVAAFRPAGVVSYRLEGGRICAVVDADGVVLVANRYDPEGRVATQTGRFGRVSSYHYGPAGVTTVSGDDGVRNVFVHDARANLTALVDSAGRVLRMSYDNRGRLVGYTDRRGGRWSVSWDPASGKPLGRVGPAGSVETWAYDAEGRIVSRATPAGTTAWAYPGPGLTTPSELVEPGGVRTAVEVSPDDLAVAVTDADGVRVELAYDADAQLVSLSDALGNATRLGYDAAGYLSWWRMPSSKTVSFANDAAGRVLAASSPVGRWSYEVSAAGRVVAGVDPVEGGWRAGYGAHGEVSSVTAASGARVGFGYDTSGNQVSVTGPDGRCYRAGYDGAGQLVGLVDPAGGAWAYQWGPEGELVATTDPAGRQRRREVDALGRTLSETDGEGRSWRRGYLGDGRLGSVVDPEGVVTSYRYDEAGRVVAVVEDGVELGGFCWSTAGRLVERRGVGGAVSYRWDAAGRLVGVGDASGSVSLVLDVDGRVLRATDERGRVISVSRDAAGRVVAVTDRRGVVRSVGLDGAGRVGSATVGPASSSFSYDQAGQLVGAVDPLGATAAFGYDLAGRLASVTDPLGASTRYGYDTAGRLSEVVDSLGGVSRLQRDPSGEVVALELAGGGGWRRFVDGSGLAAGYGQLGAASASVALPRDGAGRLAGLPRAGQLRVGAGAFRPGPELAVDALGRVSASPTGELFGHDLAGQLVEWVAPGHGAGAGAVQYRYDAGGRLVSEEGSGGQRRFAYSALDQLVSVTEASGEVTAFGYDAAGRRVSASGPGCEVSYRWDAAGRLVGVESAEGSVAISLDNLGLPVLVGDVAVDWDLSEGWPRVAGIGGVSYAWSGSGPGATLTATGPDGVARDVALDWMGSAGEVIDPWGVSGDVGVRIGYRGQLCIGGLVWLGARVYEPATRSFLSPDPLPNPPGAPCGANPYHYAWNDPVSLVDPMGLRPLTQAEFEATKHQQGLGRLGQAWQAVYKDPWGSLALGLTVVVGVALCFTPAAAMGAGILIGVGMSAGVGVATGTFNPRVAAFQGLVGGITGEAGAVVGGMGIGAQVAVGAVTGAGGNAAGQEAFTRHVDWGQVALGGAVGGLAPYLGSKIEDLRGTGIETHGVMFSSGSAVSNSEVVESGVGLPRTAGTISDVAARAGVSLQGSTVRIIDDPEYLRYLDSQGACACAPYDLRGEIHLGPASFLDEETLASTLAHERAHVLQYQAGYLPGSGNLKAMEAAARAAEGPAVAQLLKGRP